MHLRLHSTGLALISICFCITSAMESRRGLFANVTTTSSPTLAPTSVGGRQQALGRWGGAEPLGEWALARTDCLSGVFPNTGNGEYFGGLVRNGSTSSGGADALTACVAGRGVQGLADLPATTGVTLGSLRDASALATLAPRGLTFEVWTTFNATSQSALALLARPLLFIGQTNDQPGSTLADACDTTPWFNFGAYGRNGALTCSAPQYATLDDIDCLSTSASALTEYESASHLVFVLNETRLAVYFNGQLDLDIPTFFDTPLLERWSDPSFHGDYRLSVLSAAAALSGSTQPMEATLHYLAIFGVALDDDAVLQNYDAGVLNSMPVVYDANVTLNEDGEAECGSFLADQPSAYRSSLPLSALSKFKLRVVDLDNDPGHPNYELGLALDYPPVLRLAELPPVGTLYQACNASGHYYASSKDFDPVSSVGQALHRCASSFEVELYYVPPKDEFSTPGGGGDQWGQGSIEAGNPSGAGSYGLSPFTSFAYYAEDGITSERSDEDAQVVLFVAPCNDPPVSRNTSAAALSHTLWPVSVNATDVDDDESFTQAFVTALPVYGHLLRYDGSEWVNLTQVPYALPPGDSTLRYLYRGREDYPLLDDSGAFLADAFHFMTTDARGANSTEAVARIQVLTSLFATPSSEDFVDTSSSSGQGDDDDGISSSSSSSSSSSPTSDPKRKEYVVYEATPGNVTVYVGDLSDDQRSVVLRVVKTPAHGTLTDLATGKPLVNGSLLSTPSISPYTAGLLVGYTGAPHYFNTPTVRFNGSSLSFDDGAGYSPNADDDEGYDYARADSFWFHAELVGDPSVNSRRAAQAVTVVNVNDPPTLEGPPGPLDTFAIGSSSTGDKDGVGDNDNDSSSSSSEESDELFVEGFQLTDLDRDVDVVKVLVSCSYGFLDLNPDGLNNVDFNSYDRCYGHSEWSCSGDGSGDRSMLFLGQPSSVNRALKTLKYQTTYAFITDTIEVLVFDGERSSFSDQSNDDDADDGYGFGVGSCLEASDFKTVSRRGPGPFATECFVAYANVTVRVGRYAGSSDTVTPPESLTSNTQLGVAAAVFGLLIVCCMTRLALAKVCGWELRGVPTDFESDDDSDHGASGTESGSDEGYSDSDDDDEEENGARSNHRRLASNRSRHAKKRRKSKHHKDPSSRSTWFSFMRRTQNDNGNDDDEQGTEMTTTTGQKRSLFSSSANQNSANELVRLRQSIASATSVQNAIDGAIAAANAESRSSNNNTYNSDANSSVASSHTNEEENNYKFVASEWRRHLDSEGHTYFTHAASGTSTYAMPWVLASADLDQSLHEANDPKHWRAVEAGKPTHDQSSIVLYYNKATKQATFDEPRFVTWERATPAALRQAAGRKKPKWPLSY